MAAAQKKNATSRPKTAAKGARLNSRALSRMKSSTQRWEQFPRVDHVKNNNKTSVFKNNVYSPVSGPNDAVSASQIPTIMMSEQNRRASAFSTSNAKQRQSHPAEGFFSASNSNGVSPSRQFGVPQDVQLDADLQEKISRELMKLDSQEKSGLFS